MTKIREILLNLEGFQYAMSLDLNVGYYYIRLSKEASDLCTIILSSIKYKYKRLPMGVYNSPDISQEKMNEMFRGIEFTRLYIYDLLIITKGDWSNHLNKLELVQKNLRENGINCNTKKSFFRIWNIWVSR